MMEKVMEAVCRAFGVLEKSVIIHPVLSCLLQKESLFLFRRSGLLQEKVLTFCASPSMRNATFYKKLYLPARCRILHAEVL